ncbi:MAG: ATP-binding cassette domain-containing protein, partial [Agathobacter sp.]|nr:ATP-binding cassette domain-containing protein [Agathobacter sp.]
MAHFEVKNLSFSYATSPEKVALKEISILIEQGAYITICGKSGSGKTTLLRHLKSVLTPYGERTGEVLFKGKKLAEISERDQASEIGYVMQN